MLHLTDDRLLSWFQRLADAAHDWANLSCYGLARAANWLTVLFTATVLVRPFARGDADIGMYAFFLVMVLVLSAYKVQNLQRMTQEWLSSCQAGWPKLPMPSPFARDTRSRLVEVMTALTLAALLGVGPILQDWQDGNLAFVAVTLVYWVTIPTRMAGVYFEACRPRPPNTRKRHKVTNDAAIATSQA